MHTNQNKTKGEMVFNTWIPPYKTRSYPFKVSFDSVKQTNLPALSKKFSPIEKKNLFLFDFKTILSHKINQKHKMTAMHQIVESNSNNTNKRQNFPFFNRSFDKKRLKMLFSWYYANRGEAATFSLVETLQKLGFSYAMKAGLSLGVDDLKVPPSKGESLIEAVDFLRTTKASVTSGNVTALEEFQQFVDTWHRTSENLKTRVVQNFSRSSLFLKKSNEEQSKKKSRKLAFYEKGVVSFKTAKRFIEEKKVLKANSFKPLSTMKSKESINKKVASSNTILNPVYMMAFSGARGNLSQVRQLVGMRGLMADPQGQLVEFPIQSNFREGLTVTEYMISCYGARKGLVDTALRTAAAGYLTRRLVDVSHHQIVRSVTCSTKRGILFSGHGRGEQAKNQLLPSAWRGSSEEKNKIYKNTGGAFHKEKNNKVRSQEQDNKKRPLVFCVGRVLARDIPGLAFRNQEIDISLASSPLLRKVYDTIGIYIRSPLTCKLETGICQLCYGWSVSANRLVGLGEAVGIIAAQSIGEPGTQLTMRTFHTGGVFSGDIMEECRAKHSGVVCFQNIYLGLLVRTAGGAIAFCLKTTAIFQIKGTNQITTYTVSANTLLFVRQGEKVIMDTLLAQIPNLPAVEENTGFEYKTLISSISGEVRQYPTINPELASIRILAAQEYKELYFAQTKGTIFNFKKPLLSSSSFNNKAKPIEKPINQNFSEQLIQKEHQKFARVHLIWGAHRVGNNHTFNININHTNSKVIVETKTRKLEKSLIKLNNSRNNTSTFLDFSKQISVSSARDNLKIQYNSEIAFQELINQPRKFLLLRNLRFFVASKIHKNQFDFFRTSTNKVPNKTTMLTGPIPGKYSLQNKKVKNQKFSRAIILALSKEKDSGFFPFAKPFLLNELIKIKLSKERSTVENIFKDNKKKLNNFFKKQKIDHSFYSNSQFSKNIAKIINNKPTTRLIKQFAILTAWPLPPTVKSLYFYWKLVDLVFFNCWIVKNKSYSDFRILSKDKLWGLQNFSNSLLVKNRKMKGFELLNFSRKGEKITIIRDFPYLLNKVFTEFNSEKGTLLKEKVWEKPFIGSPFDNSFRTFSSKSSKPTIEFLDSGEIFPFGGNMTSKNLKKKFSSFKEVTTLNSGLLMHYNRVSYKIPLCYSDPTSSFSGYENNSILNKKEVFLSKALAKLGLVASRPKSEQDKKQDNTAILLKKAVVPQIGFFITTGDEIIENRASAYCGQIIEKSPLGLTLRLTQNILYSDLRNRPAKMNKNVKKGSWVVKGTGLVTLPYVSNITGDIVSGIPKIEQLFEARGETLDETLEKIWTSYKVAIVPRSKAVRECFKEIGLFLVAAIQKVYSSQGVHIADKHLEVIVRQMTRRALIVDPGDTEFLPEEFVDLNTIECINWTTYGENAIYRPSLIGITKASLTSNSFLSSASFQQTARVLERETILERTDRLLGLKERVMMGALINAGTGELKTSVRLADSSRAKVSRDLFQKAHFFSRQKMRGRVIKESIES